MSRFVLHRVTRGSRSLYWVGQYPLYLLPEKQGWHIYTPVSCSSVQEWLLELGLLRQFFATRHEALGVVSLALGTDGAPPADPLPEIQTLPGGEIMVCGRFKASRRQGVWTLSDCQTNLVAMVQGSLWQSAWVALYHQLRLNLREELYRNKPLVGYTHGEISRQRLVMEGADRPSISNNMLGMQSLLQSRF